MKYYNCLMSSSLFSSFQENTKCESSFFRRYMYVLRTYFSNTNPIPNTNPTPYPNPTRILTLPRILTLLQVWL